ncbi:unnamed protein product [Dovyalis caffra]|uniref:Uncharacterized protein n=1 Tax=Dovyalis caffra TaxID=77055 RepID=A0AAV1RK90_9ROSI|nr:unnamed protein product [Dovyalis caffra]
MFGRLRASSSSLDSLERPPSKILKDDSLSIYEATLMKLKLGSQRDLSSAFDEAMEMESECSTTCASSSMESNNTSTNALKSLQHVITSPDEEAMTVDPDCSSVSDRSSFSATQSTGDSKEQQSKNVSVLYLFSKYNNSRHALTPHGEAMLIASKCSVSAYGSSSNSQSLGSSKEQPEHECRSSSSVCRILTERICYDKGVNDSVMIKELMKRNWGIEVLRAYNRLATFGVSVGGSGDGVKCSSMNKCLSSHNDNNSLSTSNRETVMEQDCVSSLPLRPNITTISKHQPNLVTCEKAMAILTH